MAASSLTDARPPPWVLHAQNMASAGAALELLIFIDEDIYEKAIVDGQWLCSASCAAARVLAVGLT